ncbi:hypothetical protein CDL12_18950 [Handroanthus impetiginosus]|uniref:Transposase Tnp1/En/Spm-like domain-containing protein n=1 Tax=Handroanthus impetiginosus TaxID=429701 RepID=A0A2G9GTB5_9LAMI|nr:hypothetical protein CDL12_18950 [Handroanthus impetiginosus]
MGRGIICSKVHHGATLNVQSTLMSEQAEKLLQLKAGLEREKVKNEQMKFELDNQKIEMDKMKEGVVNEVCAEFRDEINHMKLSLDFFVSLVELATLQSALSRVTSHEAQLTTNEITSPQIHQHSVSNSCITNLQAGKQIAKASNFIDESQLSVDKEFIPYIIQESHPLLETPPHELVGSAVVLLCTKIPKEVVAEGVILIMDPTEEIDKVSLGPEFVKVVIKKATKRNRYLERPHRGVNTIKDAVGKIVAWEFVNALEK